MEQLLQEVVVYVFNAVWPPLEIHLVQVSLVAAGVTLQRMHACNATYKRSRTARLQLWALQISTRQISAYWSAYTHTHQHPLSPPPQAMLEAFVHDPLINWRLLNATEAATEAALARDTQDGAAAAAGGAGGPGPAAGAAAAAGAPGFMGQQPVRSAAAGEGRRE